MARQRRYRPAYRAATVGGPLRGRRAGPAAALEGHCIVPTAFLSQCSPALVWCHSGCNPHCEGLPIRWCHLLFLSVPAAAFAVVRHQSRGSHARSTHVCLQIERQPTIVLATAANCACCHAFSRHTASCTPAAFSALAPSSHGRLPAGFASGKDGAPLQARQWKPSHCAPLAALLTSPSARPR